MAAEANAAAEASSAIPTIDPESGTHLNSVHQRLRANSTIMQVKKLLGKFLRQNIESIGFFEVLRCSLELEGSSTKPPTCSGPYHQIFTRLSWKVGELNEA
jgi:hypothetical protein